MGREDASAAQAALLDNRTAIESLLHHGAEIKKKTRGGNAVSSAIVKKCRSAMQILLENGAEVNADV